MRLPADSPRENILTAEDAAFLSDKAHPRNSFKVLDALFRNLAKLESEGGLTLAQKENFYRNSHDFNFVARIAAANADNPVLASVAPPSIRINFIKGGMAVGRHFSVSPKHETMIDRVLAMLGSDIKKHKNRGESLKDSRAEWEREMAEKRIADETAARSAAAYGGGGSGGGGGGDGEGGSGDDSAARRTKRQRSVPTLLLPPTDAILADGKAARSLASAPSEKKSSKNLVQPNNKPKITSAGRGL